MNVSCRWLTELVDTGLAPKEIAERLTHIGLNVDAITDLPGGDTQLLVEVTSNRGDCLGHIGVARELAAALDKPLRLPDAACEESAEPIERLTQVKVDEFDLCPLYAARVIRGVRIGPSPAWMRDRLEAVGVRPVNNVVDVTNYVMMECGQPLHAFDYAALQEHRIIVRRAKAGERFVAIDHSEHALAPDRLVIADAKRAVALAGVMGGVDSEISDRTTDVLLEAAVFDPSSIRATARTLLMMSESSYRFERRVDPALTDWASRRACRLIREVAGGQVARGVAADGKPLPPRRELAMRVARIRTILGIDIPAATAADILRRLGFEVLEATADRIRCLVPSWRLPDVEREVDLVEEVARHHGYGNIPESPRIPVAYAGPSKAERVRGIVDHVLAAAGYFEAVTFSFTTREHAVRFAPAGSAPEPFTCRGTPLTLRESVAAGLVESIAHNRNVGEPAARLFEVARRFVPREGKELPEEATMLALASGDDFAAAKGVLEALFAALHIGEGRVRFVHGEALTDLDPSESAQVLLDDQPLGVLGRTTKDAIDAFGLDDPAMVAEVILDRLIEAANLVPTYQPLPQFPSILRDLAIVIDEGVTWAEVREVVEGAKVPHLVEVDALDVYRGKQVPAGKKSLALRLTLQSDQGTLTHEQADAATTQALEALKAKLGAVLRS